MEVTFETKVYEKDWEYILKGNYLKEMILRNNYSFYKRIVLINNVSNIEKVRMYAQSKVKEGVIDAYYVVEEYADEALTFFNINKSSFKGGYYYSIAELVSIYLCETDYLLHFSSDSYIQKSDISWIDKALDILKKRNDILVANPTWNCKYEEAENESIEEVGGFYVGYGFSDQCFLIRTSDFKKQIYNETHVDSNRYPRYGGELFEKRVDSYMRNHNKLRITSKLVSYIHANFPKRSIFNEFYLFTNYIAQKRLK